MGISIFANYPLIFMSTGHERSQLFAENLALIATSCKRGRRTSRSLFEDRTLQTLVGDLVAARVAAGMTQEDVAARMLTKKSVVSRLESGLRTRHAFAVGTAVEIRIHPQR